ncbi:hypothetical protein DFH08DRAFT_799820 [Mycena albidolilacea]|uniref:Uncharacterized protein n=1 Tax=Mycena albidolilacea TaxID=1033008 RepID=A0AAD7AN01_9AGAR|nr:hypothetical protein DFH08DRAFT_799820 [Mycena albidolilacea]
MFTRSHACVVPEAVCVHGDVDVDHRRVRVVWIVLRVPPQVEWSFVVLEEVRNLECFDQDIEKRAVEDSGHLKLGCINFGYSDLRRRQLELYQSDGPPVPGEHSQRCRGVCAPVQTPHAASPCTKEFSSPLDLRFNPEWNHVMSRATVVFRNGNQRAVDGELGKGAGGGGSAVDRVDDRQRSSRQMESSGSCGGKRYGVPGSGSGSGLKTGGGGNGVSGSGSSSRYLAGSRCRRAGRPAAAG